MHHAISSRETIAFRVDRRVFAVGEVVRGQSAYGEALDDRGKWLEQSLENMRPHQKPRRDSALFVFLDEGPAKRLWTKMKGSRLYRVRINGAVLHHGDMQLTEKIYQSYPDDPAAAQLAAGYWDGIQTQNPEIELLVEEATVVEVLEDSEVARRAALAKRMGLAFPQPPVRGSSALGASEHD